MMLVSSFLSSLPLRGLTLTTTLMLSPSISSSPDLMDPFKDLAVEFALPGLKAKRIDSKIKVKDKRIGTRNFVYNLCIESQTDLHDTPII